MKHYRVFWVLTGLYFLSLIIVNYIVFKVNVEIYSGSSAKEVEMLLGKSALSFPTNWEAIAYTSSFLLPLLGLIIILITTNEFTFKTHRQNIIDGLNREQFITAKILISLIGGVLSTILVAIIAAIVGIADGKSGFTFEGFHNIFYYLVQSISYTGVALLLAIFFRRGVITIGFYIIYIFVAENLLMFLLRRMEISQANFLPLKSSSALLSFPTLKKLTDMMAFYSNEIVLLIVALVYIFAFYFFSYKRFIKTDL